MRPVKRAITRGRIKGGGEHAAALADAAKLMPQADYRHEDLTEAGRSLRAQVRRFFKCCRKLVDTAADRG